MNEKKRTARPRGTDSAKVMLVIETNYQGLVERS